MYTVQFIYRDYVEEEEITGRYEFSSPEGARAYATNKLAEDDNAIRAIIDGPLGFYETLPVQEG